MIYKFGGWKASSTNYREAKEGTWANRVRDDDDDDEEEAADADDECGCGQEG